MDAKDLKIGGKYLLREPGSPPRQGIVVVEDVRSRDIPKGQSYGPGDTFREDTEAVPFAIVRYIDSQEEFEVDPMYVRGPAMTEMARLEASREPLKGSSTASGSLTYHL